MLDLKFIRDNPDKVRKALADRNDTAPLDDILRLDTLRRQKITELEELRRARKGGDRDKQPISENISEKRKVIGKIDKFVNKVELRMRVRSLEEEVEKLDSQLKDLLLRVPNIPDASVPLGKSEEDNVVVCSWGEPRQFDFTPAPHWELGEKLGIIDFDRGVKLSGTRFYVLKGMGARLQRALIAFFLDLHTKAHGYTEIYPPYMVKKDVLYGSGNLPKFADNLYHDVEDEMWFVPTAEVPLTSLHGGEILPPGSLPIHYAAYTACFRREKMSAGKDTRGIKRGHQFDKVELYKLTEPATSNDELEKLVKDAEDICQKLKIPYRVKQLCTADLGFASMKTYDIEMWAPGQNEWLEVSSCSNCGDFQARRANIRYRPSPDEKPQFVHTLNGSGLALPRVMIAVMENYQQSDGSIVVPEVLQAFIGCGVIG